METQSTDFDNFIVLDFEATCDQGGNFKPQEIIEFPSVLLDGRTLQSISEFQYFVKPTVNPQLTPFCTELTGITQEQVDGGVVLKEALKRYDEWLISQGLIDHKGQILRQFAFVTCGEWDLDKMLPSQCRKEKIERAEYFRSWINIKKVFQKFYNQEHLLGMAGMLNVLKMELEGKHHSGIQDCRNIGRILHRMIVLDKCPVHITSVLPPPKQAQQVVTAPPTEDHKHIVEKAVQNIDRFLSDAHQETSTETIPAKRKGLMGKYIFEKLKQDDASLSSLNPNERKIVSSNINTQVDLYFAKMNS